MILQKFFADKFAENSNQIFKVLIMRSKVIQERYESILEKGKIEGKQEGRLEGRLEGKLQTAKKMLNKGFAIKDIIECTELTNEQINTL